MIIEKPDPREQLDFLENAVSVWKWAVFPLQKIHRNYLNTKVWCGCPLKTDCPRIGKCPRVKWGDRSNYLTPGAVSQWLDDGYTNFGIHLGWSKLCVIDIDPRNGGDVTMNTFLNNRGYLAKFPFVMTANNGFHLYFLSAENIDPIKGYDPGWGKTSTNVKLGEGVEFLSGQHFTVAPYSIHKTGHVYKPIFGVPFPIFGDLTNGADGMGNRATATVFHQEQGEDVEYFFRGTPWIIDGRFGAPPPRQDG